MEISDQHNNWSGDAAEMLEGSDYNFQWFSSSQQQQQSQQQDSKPH